MTNHQYLLKMFLWMIWGSLMWLLKLILPSPLLQYGTEIVQTLIYLVIVYVAVQISSGHLFKRRISSINKAVLITGREDGKHHQRVGLLLSRHASDSLLGYECINERFLTAKFQTSIKDLNVICCYAPTEDVDEDEQDRFYGQLHDILNSPTGCDTGFGHNLAKRLDERGFIVFATCLFPSGKGGISLRRTCSSRVHVIGMDVTKDESVEQTLKYVKEHLKKTDFWAVVNNAGIFQGCEVEWTGLDMFKNSLEVNTLGVVRVTKAFLPLLRQCKGRVVTVTSLAGRVSIPTLSAYCMSKFAAVCFCECLRQEMHPWGVKVISIEPELFRTLLTDITRIHQNIDDAWRNSPEEIRTAYGQNYIEGLKITTEKFIDIASPKIHKVVDCIEDAVMSTEPCNTYRPYRHLLMNIFSWICEHLPKPLQDLILRIYQKINNFPTPTGVTK